MYTGFTFNGKHLTTDYDCYVSECDMSPPAKKEVKKTVPYMSGYYDFSALYGGPCFEDRKITYTVDVIGNDAADLADKKQELSNWLMPCHRGELTDDTLPAYHFLAECISVEEKEDGDGCEMKIEFSAYPFKITNQIFTESYLPSAQANVVVNNTGTMAVVPVIDCEAAATVIFGGNTYALGAGEQRSHLFTLAPGENTFAITSDGIVTISYQAEVL
jgi:hypothetical protein